MAEVRDMLDGFADVSLILRAGVYVLLLRGQVIYVGKSKSMLGRVYSHRNRYANKRRGKDKIPWYLEASMPAIHFDQILVCPCPVEDLDRLERDMIDRFRPRYNQRLKSPGPPLSLLVAGMEVSIRPKTQHVERRA